MIDKEDEKYIKYKKRVKIAKILTIVGAVLIFFIDVFLSNAIKDYGGGLLFIILLGATVYFFIPQYASWKYEPTEGRKKNVNLLGLIIAVAVIALIGNIFLNLAGVL